MMSTALIEAPASDLTCEITPLAYLEAYDAILNDDYAFVAFKERDRTGGGWRVRIRARHLTGVVFEPGAIRMQARSAAAQGKSYFTWGNGIEPSDGDPRTIEYRVHVADSKPSSIEIFVRMRKAGGVPDEAKSVSFPWPI